MHLQALRLEVSTYHYRMHTEDRRPVSIIIPCLNESEGIESLKAKLLPVLEKLRSTRAVELIFVDDGSTDDTYSKLQQSFGQQAQIVRHKRNKGISAAIRTGLSYSIGEIICTIDSDCTYHPKHLIKILDLIHIDTDIVTASPYHPKGTVRNVPAWRLFLSKSLSQIYRLILPQKLYTYTSMFRAYRREVLEMIPTTHPGFLGLVEVLVEAILRGYKVVEYPTELSNRGFGRSKLRVARVILSHLQYISKLLVRWLLKRKYVLVALHK